MLNGKRNMVLIDLDHTLSNAFWRDNLIPIGGGDPFHNWDEYHEQGKYDMPLEDMVELAAALRLAGYFLIGLTTRPEKWRQATLGWLETAGIELPVLLMRPDKNFVPTASLKVSLAKEYLGENLKDTVAFVIDDRDDVCSVFRAEGVTVLQCFGRER